MRFIVMIFFMLLMACQTKQEKPKEQKEPTPLKEVLRPLVSKNFIAEIKAKGGFEQVELIGDKLLLNAKDTLAFPVHPPLNESMKFMTQEGNKGITLIVTRTTLTTIKYQTELEEFGKSRLEEKGHAKLKPLFFLGSESDTNERTKQTYFCTEYKEERGDCYTDIRIGVDERNQYQAKLIKNCNQAFGDISLDDFPSFHRK